MNFNNDVVLRPRFSFEINLETKVILEHFRSYTKNKNYINVSVIDSHVFLKISKKNKHFWSPQLHLEIIDENESSTIKGLFGPSPVVWTLFMFFHFLIAGLFIGSGVWAYVNYNLNETLILPIALMVSMIIIWIIFYFGGQIGKQKGRQEMNILHQFMQDVISESKI